jgi:hypothetical protein
VLIKVGCGRERERPIGWRTRTKVREWSMRFSRPDTWLGVRGVIRYGEEKETGTYRTSAMMGSKRKPRWGFEHEGLVEWCIPRTLLWV